MDLQNLYSKKTNYASKNIGGEIVLVPIKNNIAEMKKLFVLNEVGAYIWDNIDDKNTIENIVELVMKEFDTNLETAKKDTLSFLEQLTKIMSGE
jgi:hypothetical protein